MFLFQGSHDSGEHPEVKLVVSELPGGITQFRSVHTKGSRYGEEYDLGAGSTENLYLLKPESSDKPWLLIGAFSRDSQNLMLDMMKTEPALVDKVGMLVLQFFDGGQAPAEEMVNLLSLTASAFCRSPSLRSGIWGKVLLVGSDCIVLPWCHSSLTKNKFVRLHVEGSVQLLLERSTARRFVFES